MLLALTRLWVQFTADKRKFGMLCGILAVGLLLWARLLIVSNIQKTAIANEEEAALAPPVDQAAELSDKDDPAPLRIALEERPKQDPFVIASSVFPPLRTNEPVPPKSRVKATEDPKAMETRLLAQLRQLVDGLRLDVAMSSAALAKINSKRYQIGDLVPVEGSPVSFELIEVRHRSVVLEYEGHRFELKMNKPGS
jgi:hypothetical protein